MIRRRSAPRPGSQERALAVGVVFALVAVVIQLVVFPEAVVALSDAIHRSAEAALPR